MKRIGILGDIGSGKSYIAKLFGYPIFNADLEVSKIYKKDKKIFNKLKKILPKNFKNFPLKKADVSKAILSNPNNLRKIVKVVHKAVRQRMKVFLKKNKKNRIVILDIPLLLENKINNKRDILVFVQSNRIELLKRLKKRKNFNKKIYDKFKKIQLPLEYKKKNSKFIIMNDFKQKTAKNYVNNILKEILNERNNNRH